MSPAFPAHPRPLTVAELAAVIGVTPSAIRQTIRRHRIYPLGKRGRAHLYDPAAVLKITGLHDRRKHIDWGESAPG